MTGHGAPAAADATSSEAGTLHDRWTLFPGLWCWALLLHQATFDKWRHSPVGWALCACAVALVLKPRSLAILAASVAVNAVYSIQCLPETANHLLFEGFVSFTWVLAFGLYAGARLRAGVPLRRVLAREPGELHPLEASRAPLAVGMLLVYWLSVLHKLNYDFVDPATSCASYMYRRVAETLPFLPKAVWAEHVAIWSTLLAEALVPVLLLYRRTQHGLWRDVEGRERTSHNPGLRHFAKCRSPEAALIFLCSTVCAPEMRVVPFSGVAGRVVTAGDTFGCARRQRDFQDGTFA